MASMTKLDWLLLADPAAAHPRSARTRMPPSPVSPDICSAFRNRRHKNIR
jgi:hypothetical protein